MIPRKDIEQDAEFHALNSTVEDETLFLLRYVLEIMLDIRDALVPPATPLQQRVIDAVSAPHVPSAPGSYKQARGVMKLKADAYEGDES